jgi:Ni,Fe-hydrogenase III small subunit
MPQPVVVMAVGTDAVSGGLAGGTYATVEHGVDRALDGVGIDVWVPGSPPNPFAILGGILLALDRLPARSRGRAG